MDNRVNIFTALCTLTLIGLLAIDQPVEAATHANIIMWIGLFLPVLLLEVVVKEFWARFLLSVVLMLKSFVMVGLIGSLSYLPCNLPKLTMWHAIESGLFVAFFPLYVIERPVFSVAIFIFSVVIILRHRMIHDMSLGV